MSRLKSKIANILKKKVLSQLESSEETEDYPQDLLLHISSPKYNLLDCINNELNIDMQQQTQQKSVTTPTKAPRQRIRNPNLSSSKNIMKNYARALVNFALVKVSKPYLEEFILKNAPKQCLESQISSFKAFIVQNKQKINCIKNLRSMLLIDNKDPTEVVMFKKLFKYISVIFLKFFSANWLWSSKIGDKVTHLKYRFKIMRRVQNPEFFTYLEDSTKK